MKYYQLFLSLAAVLSPLTATAQSVYTYPIVPTAALENSGSRCFIELEPSKGIALDLERICGGVSIAPVTEDRPAITSGSPSSGRGSGYNGNCQFRSDRRSDGRICGGNSAEARAGGS